MIKAEDPASMEEVWRIRREVFVVEQQVDESLEYDHEEESIHFLAWMDDIPVGTARWRTTEKGIKLERFAVRAEARNQGIGSLLVETVWKDLPPGKKVYLHAQTRAEAFYARHDFKRVGDIFYEAGIPHYLMERYS